MYLSLLQIKNFRCFDGNEHSITFKKGLNVLVGENDSGKSFVIVYSYEQAMFLSIIQSVLKKI